MDGGGTVPPGDRMRTGSATVRHSDDADERLIADLRRIVGRGDPVPAAVRRRAIDAFAHRPRYAGTHRPAEGPRTRFRVGTALPQ